MSGAFLQSDFMFGISTSGYHVDGGIDPSDWAAFESKKFNDEPENMNGIANDHWNRWSEDYDLLSELGVDSYRYSVEWSKVEPEEGVFDYVVIEQYREMFENLKKRNISLVLTLFHFVLPKWFADKGGFEHKKNLFYFERFTKIILDELHEYISIVTPINEILTYVTMSYGVGYWPPEKRSVVRSFTVTRILIRAHFIVARILDDKKYPIKLSTAEHIRYFEYPGRNPFINLFETFHNFLGSYTITSSIEHNLFLPPIGFFRRISWTKHRELDFVGIQFYGKVVMNMRFNWKRFRLEIFGFDELAPDVPADNIDEYNKKAFYEAMRNDVNPKYLYRMIRNFSRRYNKPVLITEIGLPTTQEKKRMHFIDRNLFYIKKAIDKGYQVGGFFFFTLLDSFEWAEGHKQKFGLVAVNRKSILERRKKVSFDFYKNAITNFRLLFKQV